MIEHWRKNEDEGRDTQSFRKYYLNDVKRRFEAINESFDPLQKKYEDHILNLRRFWIENQNLPL